MSAAFDGKASEEEEKCVTHHQKLEEGLSECRDDMVNFGVQFVSTEEWPPPDEYRVGYLEHANVDFRIGCREAAYKVL